MHWCDKAELELEQELEDGLITQEEFNEYMRDLKQELREAREEDAEAAFDNYY